MSPNNPANTGAHENWKAKNVYDMAGNVMEWTEESFPADESHVLRGGSYSSEGAYSPAAYRSISFTAMYNVSYGFRVALCIK